MDTTSVKNPKQGLTGARDITTALRAYKELEQKEFYLNKIEIMVSPKAYNINIIIIVRLECVNTVEICEYRYYLYGNIIVITLTRQQWWH